MNKYSGRTKVKCFDCSKFVEDLHYHRKNECPRSRNKKTSLDYAGSKKKSKSQIPLEDATTVFALLDVSGSMEGARLLNAKEAIMECFDKIKATDRFSLISFDTSAFMKLRPRAVGQLRKQKEIPTLLDRIFARGNTAFYDALYQAIEQVRDKQSNALILAVTDGEDNSSKKSFSEVMSFLKEFPKIRLEIVHIGDHRIQAFDELCQDRGSCTIVSEITQVKTVIVETFTKTYAK